MTAIVIVLLTIIKSKQIFKQQFIKIENASANL